MIHRSCKTYVVARRKRFVMDTRPAPFHWRLSQSHGSAGYKKSGIRSARYRMRDSRSLAKAKMKLVHSTASWHGNRISHPEEMLVRLRIAGLALSMTADLPLAEPP